MARSPYRPGSGRFFSPASRRKQTPAVRSAGGRQKTALRVAALVMVAASGLSTWEPAAVAAPVIDHAGLPAVKMFGYAHGPSERLGTAAGKAHYVPASKTRAAAALVAKVQGAPRSEARPGAVPDRCSRAGAHPLGENDRDS